MTSFVVIGSRRGALRSWITIFCALLLVASAGWINAHARDVFVNGASLSERHALALEQAYRTRLVAGRYWYDAVSGLWGLEGGPSAGIIAPALPLGRMNPRVSVGHAHGITGVFVNGREIHPEELRYLQAMFGRVHRARFWLDARGMAGYEGGPPQFNLVTAGRRLRGTGATRRGLFGSSGSDGQCSYYMHPNGSSVMTGRC